MKKILGMLALLTLAVGALVVLRGGDDLGDDSGGDLSDSLADLEDAERGVPAGI